MSLPSQQQLANAARSTRRASVLSMAHVKGMALFCAVAREALQHMRAEAVSAETNNTKIEPATLRAWLDETFPDLNRPTEETAI